MFWGMRMDVPWNMVNAVESGKLEKHSLPTW